MEEETLGACRLIEILIVVRTPDSQLKVVLSETTTFYFGICGAALCIVYVCMVLYERS